MLCQRRRRKVQEFHAVRGFCTPRFICDCRAGLVAGQDLSLRRNALMSLLPTPLLRNYLLDVDKRLQLLSLLTPFTSEGSHLLVQKQFSHNEWCVLSMLIEALPAYATYGQLLSQLTAHSAQECQMTLKQASLSGNEAVKRELRPLREALYNMRPKLEALHLIATSVRHFGYQLAPLDDAIYL